MKAITVEDFRNRVVEITSDKEADNVSLHAGFDNLCMELVVELGYLTPDLRKELHEEEWWYE